MLGKKIDHLTTPPPEFPHPIRYVWLWFQEIVRGVQGNGWSFPIITWSELESWSRLTQTELLPREARTIIALGTMQANIMSEKKRSDGGKG